MAEKTTFYYTTPFFHRCWPFIRGQDYRMTNNEYTIYGIITEYRWSGITGCCSNEGPEENGAFSSACLQENSKIAFEASKFGIDITFALFRNSLHIPTVWRLLGIVHSFQPDAIVCHSGHDSNIVGLVRFFTRNIHSELSGKRHI